METRMGPVNRYERLTVVGVAGANWRLLCDCGNVVVVPRSKVLSGNNKSCGCLRREVAGQATRKHGMANSRVKGYASRAYGVWQAMKDRCSNPNRKDFHRYGGRGIRVDPVWAESFEIFLRDMGEPEIGMTLDRIDVNSGYGPGNCRWATRAEQAKNFERNRTVILNGERALARDVAALNGISLATFRHRLYFYKWTVEAACTTPVRKKQAK